MLGHRGVAGCKNGAGPAVAEELGLLGSPVDGPQQRTGVVGGRSARRWMAPPGKESWSFTEGAHLDRVRDSGAVCLRGCFGGADRAASPAGSYTSLSINSQLSCHYGILQHRGHPGPQPERWALLPEVWGGTEYFSTK
ncbi:hypothetical protein NDU88_004436 [Pleurodeles waltl]|uniref:Uncharacterized protein n=1 Tax=Pleurodeles waltl TaxID=8319 RepID=A0AAV7VGB5_PLEWA|nr:hypothetical protein NDU88_004436 [Pleurodeles waltl]